MSRLQQRWRAVLAAYYPRWKAGAGWRCVARAGRGTGARCVTERRAVEVGAVPADDDELDALLIHEVAHATASPYHGAKWRTRLLAAARQARSVGRDNLVDLLEQDVRAYQDGAAFPKSAVYASAADAVAMNPGATFAQVTRFVAEQTGLRVGEVAAEFPRLRRVFDEARAG